MVGFKCIFFLKMKMTKRLKNRKIYNEMSKGKSKEKEIDWMTSYKS